MMHGFIPTERFFSYLTWMDIEEMPEKEKVVIIQPVGAIEQHGPHLPLIVDSALALTIPFRVILGMLSDIIGPRIVFSAILIYAALPCFAFALAQDYSQLIWSRMAIGIVGASFEVGIRMVAEWFPSKDMGFAEGIYGGWGNVGAGGAALTLPLVATAASFLVGSQGGWRYAIALTRIISAIYGVFYFFSVKDAPDGKEFQRCEHEGTIEVTTRKDFWLMIASNLPLFIALGVVAWRFSAVKLINATGVIITCVVLLGVYLFQTYANWRVICDQERLCGF